MSKTIENQNAEAVASTDLFCYCGGLAVIAVMPTNIPHPRWQPLCDRCYHHHLECAQEVNDHEMRHFGGAYGLATWDERGLEGATQNEDGYLSWQNAELTGSSDKARFGQESGCEEAGK